MYRISALLLFALLCLYTSAQSWESIRDDEQYLKGEGWGATVQEADQQALVSLISQIATNVTAESRSRLELNTMHGEVSEQSQFAQSVQTYTQATLTNTQRLILKNEPEAYVVRWVKKSEIDRIFESRKLKALDLVESALRAEEKGKADDALRNYYWALTLLKSLQYPNEVVYTDGNGRQHVLMHWLKEQMDLVFDNLSIQMTKRDGDDVELNITYKGKPVNSLDYTYFDGRSWSNIYSAKDGRGVLELATGNVSQQVQLKYEYEYLGEARIDREIESVLNVVRGTPMPKAYVNVALLASQQNSQPVVVVAARQYPVGSQSFSSTSSDVLSSPKTLDKELTVYMSIVERVVKSVDQKNYSLARNLFTDTGWDMYTKLVKYGRAKVLDSQNVRFYQDNGTIMERGLKMSFSFASGVRKSFVEDVVLLFNKEKKICNISFGLGNTAEDDILNKGVWSETARLAIMNFLENYKTAYALKRMDYIRSVFDDDAVIITATVINKATQRANVENRSKISSIGNKIIMYNRQTKDQYLRNLERCFSLNEFVNIRFANNDVMKLGQGGELYAIQIAQDYYSSSYGDKGYLFLMVDINDPQNPLIKVRTWQPEKDPDFGLYGPGDF